MIQNFKLFTLDINVENTKNYYKKVSSEEKCDCLYCQNFYIAIKNVSNDISSIFQQLGVDIECPREIYENCSNADNIVYYGGWYHVCGTIIDSKNYFSIYTLLDQSVSSNENVSLNTSFRTDCISLNKAGEIIVIDDPTVASDSLRFSFQNECHMLDDIFPKPAIQFNVHIDLPWVLDTPYSGYIDITRNRI
ncbi:MAG: hypothetical protein FWG88_10980 [Oscillospiraceae bacterium]|nr:hypothetical protein [Oscillospiraceae bacterium]